MVDVVLTGVVEDGKREAAGFLAVPWVAAQLKEKLGFSAFPGTLNVRLREEAALEGWRVLRASAPPVRLVSPDPAFCDAGCFPVVVNGAVAGAVVLPLVDGYDADVAEVVAPEGLRARFGLAPGDGCTLSFPGPGAGACGKKAVLFDFEGTLVDFQWLLAKAEGELRGVLAHLGFDLALFVHDNYAVLRNRALDLAASQTVRDELERRFCEVYERYDADALTRWALHDGAHELLDRLRTAGVKRALISNVGRATLERALEVFGLASAFDVVVTRNETTRAKPSGEGLLQALTVLGVAPADALMVGDSLSDLYAARDAGVEVALLLGGENPPAVLESHKPDHLIASLDAVTTLV